MTVLVFQRKRLDIDSFSGRVQTIMLESKEGGSIKISMMANLYYIANSMDSLKVGADEIEVDEKEVAEEEWFELLNAIKIG